MVAVEVVERGKEAPRGAAGGRVAAWARPRLVAVVAVARLGWLRTKALW
jgi:hypothetical protein